MIDNDKKIVRIETTNGNIEIELMPEVAPKHSESFIKLVEQKFFDGSTFHRVIPGFMIQGGDPLSKDQSKRELHGTGGPGYQIDAEFSQLKHERGIVSAARSQDVNSAGSQFFIMVAAAPHLDGQYSIFGKVISGMDVVDAICLKQRDARDNPIEPITLKMTIVDESNNNESDTSSQ